MRVEHGTHRLQLGPGIESTDGRPKQASMLGIRRLDRARLATVHMPVRECCPDRATGIPGRRLDPQPLERPLSKQPTVGHAVQGDSTGHAQRPLTGLRVDVPRHAQHDLLDHALDARGHIHLALRDRRLGRARRTAQQSMQVPAGHPQPADIVEASLVQPERAVIVQAHHTVQDQIDEPWLAVRRKPHELVLTRVDAEPAPLRERAVEQTRGVREPHLLAQLERVAATSPPGRRRPLAHAVERQDRRAIEWTGEERACGVRLMVRREGDRSVVAAAEPTVDLARDVELALQPSRHGARKLGEAEGRGGQRALEDPTELDERLLIEHDGIELPRLDPRMPQAPGSRLRREPVVLLDAREALFLARRHDHAILHECSGTVVEER